MRWLKDDGQVCSCDTAAESGQHDSDAGWLSDDGATPGSAPIASSGSSRRARLSFKCSSGCVHEQALP